MPVECIGRHYRTVYIVTLVWCYYFNVHVFRPGCRAKQFREALSKKHDVDCGLAMIVKQRAKANEIDKMDLVGSVDGCDAIIGFESLSIL